MADDNPVIAKHVIVVGAGAMGRDIAAMFLGGGSRIEVVLRDSSKVEVTREGIAVSVAETGHDFEPSRLMIRSGMHATDWRNADLVVEAVPEDLAMKRAIFSDIAGRVARDAIVASNASAIPISAITEGLSLDHNAIGMHFFLPAHLVPLVEIVRGQNTNPAVANRAVSMLRAAGRTPVLVNRDTPGFLANRIQHAMMREVFAVIDEGLASPEDVDAAVRYSFGMRFLAAGPLMQKELSGLDTQMAAASSIYPVLANNAEPGPILAEKVKQGHTGLKALQGFWRWTPDEAERVREEFRTALMQSLNLLNRIDQAASHFDALSAASTDEVESSH
ncbi:3-hydroxyacyl-CoA dehydrogenase [Hoeflea sp. WL0058]|uniref:3-hydroxyacyl-CoA dehydrogenase n=1 Tax=Flavimaribacter sediminis TaxID=2865987 RepID=A0AAE3D2Q0_9HYPH|nr:3-hydroxyacyl-CoA dehydrogenase NAD-binding domain-containing protein [Flavimaribacter sediminis]MBW8639066.1 3-hydroxyacyl-CoA dehydrogenase [Flavimaribacter sediminis]